MSAWQEVKLGELVDIGSSKRVFYEDYVNAGIPFYRSKEIIEKHNGNDISTDLFITKEKFEKIKEKYGAPQAGDLLLTSVGTLGIPYIVEEGEEFYFKDGNLTWFKNYKSNLYNKFLYYWIISPIGKNALDMMSIGSTQVALTIQGLKNLDFDIPPIEEQKAIASVLSSLDNKIDLLHRQNTTLERMAETLFRQWFIEEAQEDWEEVSLKEIVDIAIGRTPPRQEHQWFSESETDVKWISIKDLGNDGVYIFKTSEYLTKEAVRQFNIPLIPKDTVVLSFKMTLGRVAITTQEMLSNEAIAHFKFNAKTPFTKEYLFLFLKTYKWESLGSTSSIVTAINSAMIKDMEIAIPDTFTMSKFKQATESLFNKVKSNQQQIQTLEKLRDNLLPKLMSGEVRINY